MIYVQITQDKINSTVKNRDLCEKIHALIQSDAWRNWPSTVLDTVDNHPTHGSTIRYSGEVFYEIGNNRVPVSIIRDEWHNSEADPATGERIYVAIPCGYTSIVIHVFEDQGTNQGA